MHEQNELEKESAGTIDITSPRTAEEPGPHVDQEDGCCSPQTSNIKAKKPAQQISYLPAIFSFLLLGSGIVLDWTGVVWFTGIIRLLYFGLAYFLVGGKILLLAVKNILKGKVFNEFFLMGIATIGAFYIGEYAEGVAVMLFYVVGEHFQEAAVLRSRRSIKSLIDNRPGKVGLLKNGQVSMVDPNDVHIGDVIQVKAGEKVALDGEMLSEKSYLNTSALTGETQPDSKVKGDKVLAGMINLDKVFDLKVTAAFEDSALSKILAMVEEAGSRKAKTQKFITKFAKIYTPVVVFMAIALAVLPYFFVETYVFNEWLYRSLVFLVISCPCALVISIPLGYFGGIGAASKNGILFKGANYLDIMAAVDTVVMDKTGTLTEGVFEVREVNAIGIDKSSLLEIAAALESKSTHPVAKAIVDSCSTTFGHLTVSDVEEIAGLGLKGKVNHQDVLVGNPRLLAKFGIPYHKEIDAIVESVVVVSLDGSYSGYIIVADKVKVDASSAIQNLSALGVKATLMLSGDKDAIVQKIAKDLKIDKAFGGLMPQEKVSHLQSLKNDEHTVLAFVGDGINDAPAMALADVGIAMGGLGSDAAIESADVVIQTDQPSKIATAIKIGRKTKQIVWQNIALAFGVKVLVLFLGAYGLASLWEAVFADVGVALLAILNAIRIQKMVF